MIRILCYGDSNTWGYVSGSDHLRYNENERWPKLLQTKLGKSFEVIEEGLNSRTLFTEDLRLGKEGRNGFTYLKSCIPSHDKFDLFILMLGTNELKKEYNNSAEDILKMLINYIKYLNNYSSQIDKSKFKVLVLGIPPINESTSFCLKGDKYVGASEKCNILSNLLIDYFESSGVIYIDNQDLVTGVDGVHLTKESHLVLADKVYKKIKTLF